MSGFMKLKKIIDWLRKFLIYSESHIYFTCIYCKKNKPQALFNKEHVLPRAFGDFKDNLVLKNTVCEECNSFLGKELDLHLARGTFEGFKRQQKTKAPNEIYKLTAKQKIEFRLKQGPYAGLHITPRYHTKEGELIFDFSPQVGFKKIGESSYDYFLINNLPAKESLLGKYDLSNSAGTIILPVEAKEDAVKALNSIGVKFKNSKISPLGLKNNEVTSVKISWKIDESIKRAVAKIAFNYLAYFNDPGLLQHKDFDPIRNYIYLNVKPEYVLVNIDSQRVLFDDGISKQAILGHFVILGKDNASVVAQIFLYNKLRYTIHLANNYSGEALQLGFGHFFNTKTNEVYLLEKGI